MNFTTFWHRSRTIYNFRSTYPYNVVYRLFRNAMYGSSDIWIKDGVNPITIRSARFPYTIMYYKNGVIVYKTQRAVDESVIVCSKLKGYSTFNVIHTGDPIKAREELQAFFDLLPKRVDINRAEERVILSEQFIRYHESREHEVCKALELLYRLFGIAETTRKVKAEERDIIYRKRIELAIDGTRIDIKSYRSKNYKHPAKSVGDHPKLEVVIYYEKSKLLHMKELEEFGRNIIATIAEYADLKDHILPPSWGYNYPISGTGHPIYTLYRSLKEESLKWMIEELEKTQKVLYSKKTRDIALKIAEKSCTVKEISDTLGIPVSTVQYHLRKLKKAGIISSFRRRRTRYYSVRIDV